MAILLEDSPDVLVVDPHVLAIELGDESFEVVLEVGIGALDGDGVLGI